MAKLLVVEDDLDMATAMCETLRLERHTVEHASDGSECGELLRLTQFDLILLDWNLPGLSGPKILEQLRASGCRSAVILVTGKGSIADKETGYRVGADDYLTKPFDLRELVLRVRSLLNRPPAVPMGLLVCGDVELDPVKHVLRISGQEAHLAPRDFALLEFFMRHPGEIFHAETLIARVWESDTLSTGEAVRMAISRIRKVIDRQDKSMIENVSRVGYRFSVRGSQD